MEPWIRERVERQRREQEDRRIPLRIHQPPPEWIEHHEEQRRRQQRDEAPQRGVVIIDL